MLITTHDENQLNYLWLRILYFLDLCVTWCWLQKAFLMIARSTLIVRSVEKLRIGDEVEGKTESKLKGKWSLDWNSVDRNCVLSLDQNFINHLTEFHLTESVDQNFKITQNDINKSFDQLTKKNWRILAVDRKF